MKTRSQPKAWCKYEIMKGCKKIGFIQLVSYMCGKSTPHIEYEIDEEYRNQGIMSLELPKYLKKYCKKYNHFQLIAAVKKNNLHSIHLLEKNEFVKMSEVRDTFVYIIDLRLTKSLIEKGIKLIKKDFNFDREKQNEN